MIVIISLFSLISGIPDNRWTGGSGIGFLGFAGHQNTLAAAILLTLPGVFYLLFTYHQIKSFEHRGVKNFVNTLFGKKGIIYSLLIVNIFLIVITYSRASILALIAGIIVFAFSLQAYKVLYSIALIGIVLIFMFMAFEPFNSSVMRILSKDGGDILSRRIVLWQPSIEAIKAGGLFGIGYGMSVPGIKTPELTGSYYEKGRYVREKGNSVFALLEETGWLGLILFILPIGVLIRNFFNYRKSLFGLASYKNKSVLVSYDFITSSIIFSSLAALLVHAQFEGWWSGVGSIHLPIFYLLMLLAKNNFSS
ncbi:MAG: O-antigen ligase family protein [Ignavibacteriaceae bacterium]|nr:O-antigen ligase family protein [Ignavibacteriaceae bacterium]